MQQPKEGPNRLLTIGPNLGDYTQWVRLRAPTGRKVSRLEEGRRKSKEHKRSEPIANNRPESRGLHPVGALARTHRKKSLPIGGRQDKKAKSIKDPNRLLTIGPNLGEYTQWVRLRAPTERKVSRLEEGRIKRQKA